MNKNATFHHDHYYHVYNRTNNKERLFYKDRHREFFLRQYRNYISPFTHTHAYALLGNHFHFSIRIKKLQLVKDFILSKPEMNRTVAMKKFLNDETDIDHIIINQFQNFQNSYAKAVNKDLNRVGSLFQKKFKRSIYSAEEKYKYLIYYIHHNARKHGLVKSFTDYPHHSFNEIIQNKNTWLDVSETINQFGSINNFTQFHYSIQYKNAFNSLDIEGLI